MSYVIAVAGKGGVGKTTFSSLLVQHLCETGKKPVLAVDADANSNLNEALGVEAELSLADIREELESSGQTIGKLASSGEKTGEHVSARMNEAVTRAGDYDLLVMGHSQGKECYCYINALLSRQIKKMEAQYPYILVDNEAGMEHISRGLLPKVDAAILISDCSKRGIQAAGRISKLMKELNINPDKFGLVVNRAAGGVLNKETFLEIEKQELPLLGVIPRDEEIYQMDCDGKPLTSLSENSAARSAFRAVLADMGL